MHYYINILILYCMNNIYFLLHYFTLKKQWNNGNFQTYILINF